LGSLHVFLGGVLCVCDTEERECGVGAGVNTTMLSETLYIVGLADCRKGVKKRLPPYILNTCNTFVQKK
jgi:hypothetical protein